jgi:hypothetical protein
MEEKCSNTVLDSNLINNFVSSHIIEHDFSSLRSLQREHHTIAFKLSVINIVTFLEKIVSSLTSWLTIFNLFLEYYLTV